MTKENKAITAFIIGACALMAIALCGCKTVQPTATDVRNDSIETYTKHDTIFQTKADSATLNALMHCDSNYNVVLDELATANGERIKLSAALNQLQTKSNNNTPQFAFNVDCKEDSLQHHIEWLEKQIRTMKKDVVVKQQSYIPDYNKNCTRGFWVLLVILIVIIAIWIFKKYIRLKSGGLIKL